MAGERRTATITVGQFITIWSCGVGIGGFFASLAIDCYPVRPVVVAAIAAVVVVAAHVAAILQRKETPNAP